MTSHIFAFHPGSTINESLAIQHPGNWCSKIFWFLQRNSAQISLQQRHCSEWKHQSRSQKLHSPCTIDKEVPWKLSKQKPMKSCTSIFGDPQKWPWDPVRPATCTPVSNGWLEVEKNIQESTRPMKYAVEWRWSNLDSTVTPSLPLPHKKNVSTSTFMWMTNLKPGIVGHIRFFEGFMDGPQDFANGSQPTFWPSILKNPLSLESLENVGTLP